jgi:hypothetical protein
MCLLTAWVGFGAPVFCSGASGCFPREWFGGREFVRATDGYPRRRLTARQVESGHGPDPLPHRVPPGTRARGEQHPRNAPERALAQLSAWASTPARSTRSTSPERREQGRTRGQVMGMLLDAEGEPVELPRVGTLTVPIRWLHPMDEPVSPGHHDASIRGG